MNGASGVCTDNIELLRQLSDCIDEIAVCGGLREVLKRARQERQALDIGFGTEPQPSERGHADAV